ncbi:MAG TPA: AarF/UbiB family protein, partial [Puia sp.]|nr:AarF/UbiB family protein [Puia sp.]
RIPAIIWELSGTKIITMEVFEGVWLSEVFTGKAAIPDNFNAAGTATAIVQLFLRQIFIDGFFHADPHPGNIILLPNGQIGLIDFGIIGVMNSEFKRNMMELLSKISERDTEGAFHAVVKIVKPPKDVDLGKLQKEYEDNLNTWYNGLDIPTLDFHEKTATSLLLSNIVSLQKNKITLPNVVAQFYRCIILLESVALSLNPDKSIFSELEFFFDGYRQDIMRKTFSLSGLWKVVQSYQKMFFYLPGKLESLFNKFTQDELEVRPYVDNIFKAFLAFLNVLSFSLFVAVVVLLIMRLFRPSTMEEIRGWNTFLVIFFVFLGGVVTRFLRRYISIEFR